MPPLDDRMPASPPVRPGEPRSPRWCQCSPAGFAKLAGRPRASRLVHYQQLDPRRPAYHTYMSFSLLIVWYCVVWQVDARDLGLWPTSRILHPAFCFFARGCGHTYPQNLVGTRDEETRAVSPSVHLWSRYLMSHML